MSSGSIQSRVNIHTAHKQKPFAPERQPTSHLDWHHRWQQNWHYTAFH
jgi:hypothetical protein